MVSCDRVILTPPTVLGLLLMQYTALFATTTIGSLEIAIECGASSQGYYDAAWDHLVSHVEKLSINEVM